MKNSNVILKIAKSFSDEYDGEKILQTFSLKSEIIRSFYLKTLSEE